jgi:hypothetical protein
MLTAARSHLGGAQVVPLGKPAWGQAITTILTQRA